MQWMETVPMKANPGGQLAPSQVVGRDELVRRLWRILERQSLVLSAERRIGKTSLMKKMIAEAEDDDGRLMVYHDLEGVHTRLEFVEILFHDVESHLSRFQRTARRTRDILSQFGGAELKRLVKLPSVASEHWKNLLTSTLEDLMEQQQRPVVLFWDKFSLLLYNIHQQEGLSAATELLDVLRSLRQMHPSLRMVFTGSVGLLNVIGTFKQGGYANDPLNDMYKMIVPALSHPHATDLARRLLMGENIACDDPDQLAATIAAAVDDLPYFVHHVVDQFAFHDGKASQGDVRVKVSDCLSDPADPWDLRHYLERIRTYYPEPDQPLALALLDALASTAEESFDFESLFYRLTAGQVTEDREAARQVLTMLQRDHYVMQENDGRYRFVFPLIRRWWALQRG